MKVGILVVGLTTTKVKPILNLFLRFVSNNYLLSNFNLSTYEKAISVYTTKNNDHQHFQLHT